MTPRKPRKWNLPLTYAPKIEAVRNGTCTQTIRITGKIPKKVGDLISLHGYENGRGTPWTWRMPYKEITEVIPMFVFGTGVKLFLANQWVYYGWHQMNWIATLDGIVPPTGEALRDVLVGMNGKIPEEGVEAQVIRWKV